MESNNNSNHNEEYIEIDLREYIRTLWKNKWIIIILVIISVLAAGLYSKYITKPKYQARATLLILPSTYKTSLELDTLPINTYRSLAVTDSIKNKIIEEVDLRDEEGNLYAPSYLNSMLNMEVQTNQQTSNDE
jgi:capsular polysaccharide biosynthesis protein